MKVHHLDCATLCPPLATTMVHRRGYLACHCLLVESADGLVLVDTGLGERDIADPAGRLGAAFLRLAGPRLLPEQSASAQVRRLGFAAADVRHIVLTHLDLDHAGGLSDFPRARVHVTTAEHEAAMRLATSAERRRYRPAQWAHDVSWVLHPPGGDEWMGLAGVRPIAGPIGELLLVPLPGHTRGHAGVAVRADDGWLLHCGDAYYHLAEIDPTRGRCPPGLALTQRLNAFDRAAQLRTRARLRTLARDRAGEVRLFSAHDPDELP